jgi:hypothetical protein
MSPQDPLSERPKRLPVRPNHVVHIGSGIYSISLGLGLSFRCSVLRGAGVNPAGKHGETDVLQEKGESLAGDRGRFGTLGGGVAAHEVGGRGETSGREELECFAGLES